MKKEITAVLVIDPYNDFISEGGKVWDRLDSPSNSANRREMATTPLVLSWSLAVLGRRYWSKRRRGQRSYEEGAASCDGVMVRG